MNLLEYQPQRIEEEQDDIQPNDNSSKVIVLTEIERTCVVCGFHFVQSMEDTLMCECWNCKRERERRLPQNSVDLPIQRLPFMPSTDNLLADLRKRV